MAEASSIRVMASVGLPALLAAAQPAMAQRVEENVSAQSADAFGQTVGNDKSGLYNQDDVRGFNPYDAGNIRLEGMTIDLSTALPSGCPTATRSSSGSRRNGIPFPRQPGSLIST